MMRRFRKSRGFTLIEVAIAVAILSAGFATLMVIQGRSIDQSREEHNRLLGTLAAQYLLTMELLKKNKLTDATDRSGELVEELQANNFFDGAKNPGLEADYRQFGFEMTFAPLDFFSFKNVLTKVESRVYWDGNPDRGVYVTQLIPPPIN